MRLSYRNIRKHTVYKVCENDKVAIDAFIFSLYLRVIERIYPCATMGIFATIY